MLIYLEIENKKVLAKNVPNQEIEENFCLIAFFFSFCFVVAFSIKFIIYVFILGSLFKV